MEVVFRNFDNRDRYYDRKGNPLCGCLQFMIKGGNTVAPIFDGNQVPLANPQLTDKLGRTDHQVFVNSDVIAYVYKYIGSGTLSDEEELGIDTSDIRKWELQYTIESVSLDTKDVDGASAMGVSDIDSLRGLDVAEVPVVDGSKTITLNGYYEAGDCEPVSYVWDSESTLNDDNGSVIAPDGVLTGRWILVQPTEHCDSRHFGVFPQDSADAVIDQSTRIGQLISYCNTKSIKPYFNGSISYPYFIYNSVSYNSRNTIDVSNDTKFVDKGNGNRFFGEWNGNPYFVNARTMVNSKTVRHSWHFQSYGSNTVKYIVDDRWSPVLLSGMQVELEVSPASGSQFNDCEITSNEMISDRVVMENLEIRTDWFADDYNWADLSVYGCRILLQNCKDANTYVTLKNKQGEANYGDLGEQTVSGLTLRANCIAENAVFSNVTLNGDAELHNVSGTVSMANTADNINAIDCWLTFTGNPVLSNLQLRRGSLGGNFRVLSVVYVNGADIVGSLNTSGASSVQLINCNISGNQYLGKVAQVTGCTISGDIVMYPESHTVEISGYTYSGQMFCGEFYNNVFIGNTAAIKPTPRAGADYASTLVGILCKFIGNTSNHDFVDDTSWEGVAIGSRLYSQMVYQENHGGCPEEYGEITVTFPYRLMWQPEDPFDYRTIPDGISGNSGLWIVNDWRGGSEQKISTSIYWVINFASFPLATGNVFRLKAIGNRMPYVNIVNAEVRSFIRTDSYGLYCHSFDIGSPLVEARLSSPTTTRAELTCVQPLRYMYTESRYYGNDDIDRHRSTLYYVTLNTKDDPTRYNASLHLRYKLN